MSLLTSDYVLDAVSKWWNDWNGEINVSCRNHTATDQRCLLNSWYEDLPQSLIQHLEIAPTKPTYFQLPRVTHLPYGSSKLSNICISMSVNTILHKARFLQAIITSSYSHQKQKKLATFSAVTTKNEFYIIYIYTLYVEEADSK